MPNHCYNRVTIYGSGNDTDETRAQIAKIKSIFEDEAIFTHFIPEPDWATTPNKDGELPTQPADDNPYHMPFFKSTGTQDARWYDWRLQHWGGISIKWRQNPGRLNKIWLLNVTGISDMLAPDE